MLFISHKVYRRVLSASALVALAGCSSSSPSSSSSNSGPKAVEASDVTHIAEQSHAMSWTSQPGTAVPACWKWSRYRRARYARAQYTYQVNVINRTDKPLQNVVLRATQPQGLEMARGADGGPTTRPDANGWISYNVGTLGPRETRPSSSPALRPALKRSARPMTWLMNSR